MKEMAKKVNLLKPFNIENVNIRKDRYFPDAYIIDLPLDSVPDHVWQDIFERTWKASKHLWDRKLFVISDKLRLVTPAENFGEKLGWIEQIIVDTNKGVENHKLAAKKAEEIRIEQEVKKQKLWEEKATVERMKEALRKRYT